MKMAKWYILILYINICVQGFGQPWICYGVNYICNTDIVIWITFLKSSAKNYTRSIYNKSCIKKVWPLICDKELFILFEVDNQVIQ